MLKPYRVVISSKDSLGELEVILQICPLSLIQDKDDYRTDINDTNWLTCSQKVKILKYFSSYNSEQPHM